MTDTNHLVIVGRLTRDIGSDERSFAYIANGQARANVSIAVNRSRKNGDQWVDEVNYFDVTIWGRTAENLKPYLLKGKQILVEGHLKQDRWEKDGQKFNKISIVADNVQLLGGRSEGSGQQSQSGGFTPRFQNNNAAPMNDMSAPSGYEDTGFGGNDSGFPEDIPF